jgi:cell division protein FtsZ
MASLRSIDRTNPNRKDLSHSKATIVGLGGAGTNLLTNLMDQDIGDSLCVAVDTDRHALEITNAHHKIMILHATEAGRSDVDTVKDLGMRMNRELHPVLGGRDLVFVLAGMGGIIGGGTAPIIAETARRNGAVVIGVVTRPFRFERDRFRLAVESLRQMITVCDTVFLIDNDASDPSSMTLPFNLSLDPATQTCLAIIHSIAGNFRQSNLCNAELGELRTLLRRGGLARASVGHSYSHLGAEDATLRVLRNAVVNDDLARANGVFINITGGEHVQRAHVESAVNLLSQCCAPSAQLLYEHRIDQTMRTLTSVTLLTTGISFPASWREYRKIPLDLYDLEAESGNEEDLGLKLGLQQLETQVTQANL